MAVTGGLALLVYAVVDAVNVGWGATRTIVCLAAAIVLLIAFVAIELRQRDPLMPFRSSGSGPCAAPTSSGC